jgi:hypothetical protein
MLLSSLITKHFHHVTVTPFNPRANICFIGWVMHDSLGLQNAASVASAFFHYVWESVVVPPHCHLIQVLFNRIKAHMP